MKITLSPSVRFKQQTMLFPFYLVLFEFATYIGNDMIQPGMLAVIADLNADATWVPTSMTAYLSGSLVFQWLFGPLSDHRGRRPVMLAGVGFFTFSCLIILLVHNIEQFIFIRFFQGIGLCFVGAVGYSAIQETFEEASCIKIMALMANVTLIAPLFGPLAGTALINFISWQSMFILIAVLSSISFYGLWKEMPETVILQNKPFSSINLWHNYCKVLSNRKFIYGALSIGFSSLPLLTWIAESPVILIRDEGLSTLKYGLLQIPIFSGLIFGNIILTRIVIKTQIESIIKQGIYPIIFGLFIATLSTVFYNHAYVWVIAGLSLYAFGIGLVNTGLYRLTLFSIKLSKGVVSSAIGIFSMLVFTIGIECSKIAYSQGGNTLFNCFNLISGFVWFILIICFFNKKHKTISK
ncbi:Multidrug transporter MdfA [Candidatus Ecksteinia adelgidicola]|nr:Multidrug transporter MdfA [Candidatus Ecksteinia adelgidicola]